MARSKSKSAKSSANNLDATSVASVEAASAPVASNGGNGKSISGPEIVKAVARPNVVPFSLEEEIRRRAYELYVQRGPNGSETDDWLVAEREVLQRYQEHRV